MGRTSENCLPRVVDKLRTESIVVADGQRPYDKDTVS